MTPEEIEKQRYLKLMEERSSLLPEDFSMEQEEMAAPRADNTQLAMAGQQKAVAEANAKSGTLETAGDATMAGGMATANPYVAAAGLVMKTAGQVDSAKRNAEQAKIDAYNKKIMARRSAVRNIFA